MQQYSRQQHDRDNTNFRWVYNALGTQPVAVLIKRKAARDRREKKERTEENTLPHLEDERKTFLTWKIFGFTS